MDDSTLFTAVFFPAPDAGVLELEPANRAEVATGVLGRTDCHGLEIRNGRLLDVLYGADV